MKKSSPATHAPTPTPTDPATVLCHLKCLQTRVNEPGITLEQLKSSVRYWLIACLDPALADKNDAATTADYERTRPERDALLVKLLGADWNKPKSTPDA